MAYERIKVNPEPIQNTVHFMKREVLWHEGAPETTPKGKYRFDMGNWITDAPWEDDPDCGALCCTGGSMIIANGLDYSSGLHDLSDLMGVPHDVANALFHPPMATALPDEGALVHWQMTRKQAIEVLEGIINGTIGYSSDADWPFGYVAKAEAAA